MTAFRVFLEPGCLPTWSTVEADGTPGREANTTEMKFICWTFMLDYVLRNDPSDVLWTTQFAANAQKNGKATMTIDPFWVIGAARRIRKHEYQYGVLYLRRHPRLFGSVDVMRL